MFDEQLQRGMDWVAARLARLSEGQGVDIRPLGWDVDTAEFDPRHHHYVVSLNGRRHVATFDDDDLGEVPDDPRMQLVVDGDLRAFLNDELRGSFLLG